MPLQNVSLWHILIIYWLFWAVKLFSHVRLLKTPWTVAHQAPLFMGFFRQEYWSALSFPSPGDLPDPGIKPRSPSLQVDALNSESAGKPILSSSVQFSRSVVSDSLQPHESQHTRPPCPSPTPRVYSNSCPLSQWCHPAISSSVVPFSSQHQGLFQWLFAWGGQSTGVSASTSVLPMICFRMDWLDLLVVQAALKSLLQHNSSKASIFPRSAFFTVQLSHPYMTTGKTTALTRRIFVGKVMSLVFNMLSRLVITFLPRSKHLLISWLQSPSAVILEPPKIKSDTASTVYPSISYEVMGSDAMILVFWMLSFKPTFSLFSFTFLSRPLQNSKYRERFSWNTCYLSIKTDSPKGTQLSQIPSLGVLSANKDWLLYRTRE